MLANEFIMGSAMLVPREVRVHMTQSRRPRQFWNNDEPDEMIIMSSSGEDREIELRPAQPIEWYPGPDMIAEMCPQILWQISDDRVHCIHDEAH